LSVWLRWSLRDLRARWVIVIATALIIALGTGMYASLSGQKDWRRESLAASIAEARAHDLRFSLAQDAYAPARRMLAAARDVDGVAEAEERLVTAAQVDASRPGDPLLVPARIVGVPVSANGPRVDRIAVDSGRGLRPADRGENVAVLEQQFVEFHGLPGTGAVRVGPARLRYVGTGTTPDYFLLTSAGGWGAEANLAVVFTSLETAQRTLGLPGRVNELVVRARPGADLAALESAVRTAVRTELPGTGLTVTRGTEEDPYRTLYRDAANDGRLFMIYAFLLLAAAAFSAFVLITRVVDAQRREIGIGMALGAPPRALATRPLLIAAEIALLGVVLGMGVGVGFGSLLSSLVQSTIPLPHYTTLFSLDQFAIAAALGFTLPFAAAIWPVARGVRQTPVEAIHVGARTASRGGLAPLLRRIPLPGRSLAQMPLRNVLRTPRRTLLTVLGIAAGLAALVSLAGMVDSMRSTIDTSRQETLRSSPQRLSVTLQGFLPSDSKEVAAVRALPQTGEVEPGLLAQATLRGRSDVEVALQTLPSRDAIWRPRLSEGALGPEAPGIVISELAAETLGVGVGDVVPLRHPVRGKGGAIDLVETEVPIAGIHPNPFRFLAYVDESHLAAFNLAGVANVLTVTPSRGSTLDDVERALFGAPGVASVERASGLTDSADAAVDEFLSAIVLTETIVFGLALLIAFNATSISTDERRRETATMFAFGVPVRGAVRIAIAENIVVGILATVLGVLGGMLLVRWMIDTTLPDTFPEFGVTPSLGAGSIVVTLVAGIGAVTLAPLMTARRLRRMDVPATLRVVE
jgi:putative ABC transport system permease protein